LRTPRSVTIAISMAFAAATSLPWTLGAHAEGARVASRPSRAGCTITGTPGNDRLIGTAGPDVICGLGGGDRLRGRNGDDLVLGGRGNDDLFGGAGNDTMKGGGGADSLVGGLHDDRLRGGARRDDLTGSEGFDRIVGDSGNDRLDALDGTDQEQVRGQDGRDSCVADLGDTIDSCERADTPPPAPTDLDGSATASEVGLDWSASPGAIGYTVYRDGSPLSTATSPSYTDTAVAPQTGYSYTVDAFNGSGSSPRSSPFAITTPPGAEGTSIVMAAGDIACDPADRWFNDGNGTSNKCRQRHTAELLSGADHILTLGDQQYECGGLSAFRDSYDLSWGRFLAITHPILADEEYGASGTGCGEAGADGYFSYFADRLATHGASASDPERGYYSFDIGAWHVIALNSECSRIPGGCGDGGAQNDWLEQDLAASGSRCTIALTHQPLFASKAPGAGVTSSLRPTWNDLYDHGVEMVLSGDSHWYERFAPQAPDGSADPNGVVQWIVGAGGKSHGGLALEGARMPHSETATAATFGVLRLELGDDGYAWRYKVEGSSSYTDSGAATCH